MPLTGLAPPTWQKVRWQLCLSFVTWSPTVELRPHAPDSVVPPAGLAEGEGAGAPSFTVLSSTTGLPAGAFDGVVSSLVLCSVDDVAESAADLYRWLKPGGTLLFMEHMAHGQQTKAKRLCDKCAPAGLGLGQGFGAHGLLCMEHVAHKQQTKAKHLCNKCA